LPGVGSEDLHAAVKEAVATGSKLYTDNFRGYNGLDQQYQHNTVNHSAGEYVKGETHTNTIESFWAIVKRAHYGTFHYWSRKHLARYIDEFVFKANINGLPAFDPKDITCGITVVRAYMAGMDGRRLTYKALIEK
jgi:transposase-like protein